MGLGSLCLSPRGVRWCFLSQETTYVPTKDLGQIKGESCSRNNALKIGVKLGHLVRPEQLGWGAAGLGSSSFSWRGEERVWIQHAVYSEKW